MTPHLHTVFGILPGEGRKLACFGLLAGLLQGGVAIGFASADSLFLAHLGVGKLPLVYIFMPVVMAIYAPVYAVLLGRLGMPRLFLLTLAVLTVAGVAFGFGGDFFARSAWFLFLMKFYVGLWFIALYTLFWNLADDYFSILDGKRLYGIIAAGGSAGAMGGSALVAALAPLVPISRLFLAWSILALLTIPVFLTVTRGFRKIVVDDPLAVDDPSPGRLLRSLLAAFKSSPFAVAVTAICFTVMALTGMLEYLAFGVFSQGQSAEALAGLLGRLQAAANGLTLAINLLFFNRIVGRIGIGNTALIVPGVYLAAFGLFYLHYGFAAAAVAFFAYQSLLVSIEYNNVNLLFNALPSRVKPQVRTFIEAMAEPAATATAGMFLLLWANQLGPENIALSGLVIGCVALGIAFFVRSDYVQALAMNLRADWLNFARPEEAWQRELSEHDRELFRTRARQGPRDQQLVALDLLWRLGDPEAQPALLEFVSSGDAVARRWAIRAAGDLRDSRHARNLLPFLVDPDPELRLEAFRALRKLAVPDTPALLGEILPLVSKASSPERQLILEIAGKIGDAAAVEPLLIAAQHFSATESRHLEGMVLGLGLKAIPAVIHVLRNPSAPFHSRSLAGRALGRLAMPQLLLLSGDLIAAELARAHDASAARHSLARAAAGGGPGATVLTRYFRDGSTEGLEFALELLSLSGRLPDFDLIRASLAFANPKDRANALETVQQSCPRKLFNRIRPLIEENQGQSQPHDAGLATLPIEQILRRSMASDVALEASAAFLAFRELGYAGGVELLRARLGRTEPGAVKEWLVALLPRLGSAHSPLAAAAYPVHRVAALLGAAFFQDARIPALDYIAGQADERAWAPGEVIYEKNSPTEMLFIITGGTVSVSRGDESWPLSAGATFGERVLMGDVERRERVVSGGCRALVVPGRVVARAIEVFPTMGISLFQFKTLPAVV